MLQVTTEQKDLQYVDIIILCHVTPCTLLLYYAYCRVIQASGVGLDQLDLKDLKVMTDPKEEQDQ